MSGGVAATLTRRLSPQRVPGAVLLTGAREEDLDREASALAASLLCPGEDPDGGCDSCRRAGHRLHPDLLRVEPEGVQIRIDRVREAIAFASGRPYESARRVVLVARAELLGPEAANALLKCLEEPGAHIRWILTTTRPESLLPTIRSRCVPVRVPPPSRRERRKLWGERGLSDEDAADLVALLPQDEAAGPEALAEARELRQRIVSALRTGLVEGRVGALILLAEELAAAEPGQAGRLAELLADAAALAGGGSPEALRHRAEAGPLRELASRVPARALRDAAAKALDAPPDNRRGNLRMHFEAVLLGLCGH